jgi:GTP-binding protein Era
MLILNQHPLNKSILVGVLGTPNSGKSSLVNCLLGFDLSAVTHKAQTTRNKFHCVFTVDRTEIILTDTPGIHNSVQEINKRMNQEAIEGGNETDLNLLIVDVTDDIFYQLNTYIERFSNVKTPLWIVLTKSDLLGAKGKDHKPASEFPVEKIEAYFREKCPVLQKTFLVSAHTGDEIHRLTGSICDAAQGAPHLYGGGMMSNKNERFFVTEYIREQSFMILRDELPYELAVVIDSFKDLRERGKKKLFVTPGSSESAVGKDGTKDDGKEKAKPARAFKEVKRDYENEDDRISDFEREHVNDRKEGVMAHISATILVNRPSQRAIVVGAKGSVIKEIGSNARKKIEAMLGGKVFLNLHVKVCPKWFKNNTILEEIGLYRAVDSNRVWRKRG